MPSLDERLGERLDATYREALVDRDADQMRTKREPEIVELRGVLEQQPS